MAGETESVEPPPQEVVPSSPVDVEVLPEDPAGALESGNSKYLSQSYRHAAGAGYALATGVCGIVLVALSSSLQDLAAEVGKTSVEVKKQIIVLAPK